ncbi:UPF0450 protein C17orf58 homolog isoform X2 [Dendrobates tinctorius]|uniref:UPF0450 protein C17orf58 homolog isoform X2 n=1 Tax=Dendrobates tinctorius TaxID=92724 RepID=UPI003CCA37B0
MRLQAAEQQHRMTPGAGGRTRPILLLLLITSGARRDGVDGRTLDPYLEVRVRPASALRSGFSMSKGGKMMTSKLPLDNHTGLRKADPRHHDSPTAHRNYQLDSVLTAPHNHTKGVPHHESNRPGKSRPQAWEATQLTNRHPMGPLPHRRVFRKDGAERTCAAECHREREEREVFCHSDFAVNGIIHDVEVVGGGARILTVLVSSGGSYKTGQLYLTPDSGVFSRVTVLALHTPHLQLGGRYIMMGQIYRRGMQLPPAVLRVVSGRLRAGDGLVTSGSSIIRRFNRRKDGRGLWAALSKCT